MIPCKNITDIPQSKRIADVFVNRKKQSPIGTKQRIICHIFYQSILRGFFHRISLFPMIPKPQHPIVGIFRRSPSVMGIALFDTEGKIALCLIVSLTEVTAFLP